MTSYRSIASRVRHEPDKIKGSRHIATLMPIGDESQVQTILTELRTEFPGARHHAYAWRLGRRGERFYYSDDGEPSGSAGRPILQHLEGRELTQVLLVISRIFGGTKLGVGGLVRAYGGAAAEVLRASEIVVMIPKVKMTLVYPYSCTNAIQALVHAHHLETLSAEHTAQVTRVLEVVEADSDAIAAELRETTAGVVVIEIDHGQS